MVCYTQRTERTLKLTVKSLYMAKISYKNKDKSIFSNRQKVEQVHDLCTLN